MSHQLKVKCYFAILLCALAHWCFALPSDQQQVMHVFADSADLSQLKHRGVYKGNVTFEQGTTHISATTAITKGSEKNELTLAIVIGNSGQQAHFWTETEVGKPPIHAYADKILYYPLRHLIELRGHARVEQGKNSFAAAKIRFDTLKQHVVSQSDKQSRTTIILYPETKPS